MKLRVTFTKAKEYSKENQSDVCVGDGYCRNPARHQVALASNRRENCRAELVRN